MLTGLEAQAGIQKKLKATLDRWAGRLREVGLPGELSAALERLAGDVTRPCVVAVVGEVKVGKSTFVNALLGGDLAKVGTEETTATINHFSRGNPIDPSRPVRCHWRSGNTTDEDRAFLDSLQGNDVETLERAEGIEYLEYFVPNPLLEQITLVDTPGTGAVVEEHRERAEEFFMLERLRKRHDEETKNIRGRADAVIYLLDPVGRADDREFLERFREVTGGQARPHNALGVLSKIEKDPEIVDRRREFSEQLASQFRDSLNTVIPAGAGVRRVLDNFHEQDGKGLERLVTTLRLIPRKRLAKMLEDDERFFEREYKDSPVGPEERRELARGMPWAVFTTIARIAADPDLSLEEVEKQLDDIAGFERLKKVLKEHFIERSHILRCYRIVEDARKVLGEIGYTALPRRREEVQQERDRLDRFVAFIRRANGDSTTAGELEEFVYRHLDVEGRVKELEELHGELAREIDDFYQELKQYNADFEALQKLEGAGHTFSEEELKELWYLLGLHGGKVEKRLQGEVDAGYVSERALYWKARIERAPSGSDRRTVVEQAHNRYASILHELYK